MALGDFCDTIYNPPPPSLSLFSEVISSQPVPTSTDNTDGVRVAVESFTQPSRFDELIIGTQIPCTPGASQVSKLYIYLLEDTKKRFLVHW